jgi:uncharacterized protein (TIGR03083 family)
VTQPDPGDVYDAVRLAFVRMLRAAPSTALATAVPATPAWTVKDVVAHVVGLAADLNALRFPDADDTGGDRFSARQVSSRAGCTLDELIAEWDVEAPVFEGGLRAFGYEFGSHFVADVHAHYHDVRAAVSLSDDPDPVAVGVALDHYLGHIDEQLTARGEGRVRMVADGLDRTVGRGEVVATLRTEPFTLLRVLSARRSLREVRALPWTGDVDRALALIVAAFDGGYAFPP